MWSPTARLQRECALACAGWLYFDSDPLQPVTASCLCVFAPHRLMEKHVPNKQKTIFIHSLAEKLEMAPPEMFAAEVRYWLRSTAIRTQILRHIDQGKMF